MEIILIQDVDNLGAAHEKVSVKNGYARNFLIPQKKAIEAKSLLRRFLLRPRGCQKICQTVVPLVACIFKDRPLDPPHQHLSGPRLREATFE